MADSLSSPTLSLQELTHTVVRQLTSGKSKTAVIQDLVARGWPEASAKQFVANAARSVAQPQPNLDEDDEHRYVAELFRRRIARDCLLSALFMIAMLVCFSLSPAARALAFFFLSMCVFSFVDLLVSLVGWWRNRR